MNNLYVVTGRFQPFHDGHFQYISNTIDEAVANSSKVLILIGSAFESRSPKNPWTYQERVAMITEYFKPFVDDGTVSFKPLVDYRYDNDKWLQNVEDVVSKFSIDHSLGSVIFSVVGKDDATKEYQDNLVKWGGAQKFEAVSPVHLDIPYDGDLFINATNIRSEYFAGTTIDDDYFPVPQGVKEFLEEFRLSGAYRDLVNEVEAVRKYKRSWADAPFPPVFIAADNIPVWYDAWGKPHVAMITRKSEFGNGKMAFAGGYLEVGELVEVSAVRELREEMGEEIANAVKGKYAKLHQIKVFDEVGRSARGRMVTFVYEWHLPVGSPQPKLVAGDDAATANWVGIDVLANSRDMMFADHWHILDKMLNISKYENIKVYQ